MASKMAPNSTASTSRPPQKRRSNEAAPNSAAPKRRRSGGQPSASGRVNVAVRVRPLREREAETSSIVRVVDERCLVFDPKAEADPFYFQGQRACGGLVKPNKDQTFMFDKVFDETKDNMYVFEHTTKEMVVTLLDGCNCSVFAYGATGAGKTFTMLGTEHCPGVVSLTVSHLYECVDKLRSEGQSCEVAVAYLEVYNEVVRDLLCPGGPPLIVRDDPAKGIAISNLTVHKVREADALLELLLKGNKNRTQHATDANAESSRSHAIFQVYVTQTETVTGTSKGIRASKMSFIDLAGSERAAAVSRNIGARLREGTKINLSLLALGNCIDALSKNGVQRIPYRGSKLTHILKDSLGGTCRTLMIAAVTPSKLSYTDTYNTLKYAERAMKIELQAKKNIMNVNVHMSMYTALIEEYKQKVDGLQRKLDSTESEKAALVAKVQELEKSLESAVASRDALPRAAPAVGSAGKSKPSTPVMSPETSLDAPDVEYCVNAAQKLYGARAKLMEQIWKHEAVIRTSLVKENWKQQIARSLRILHDDSAKEAEKLDTFLQAQASQRFAAKEALNALHAKRRRNFECGEELADKAAAAGCTEMLNSEVAALEQAIELVELRGQKETFAQLAEVLGQECNYWEGLNAVALPHLQNLYTVIKGRDWCSMDQREAHVAVIKKAKGRGVTWADEQEMVDGAPDLTTLLHAPDWRLPTTVRRKSASVPPSTVEDSLEGCPGDVTFVRLPHGSPHPRRHRRSRSSDGVAAPVPPSWSPSMPSTSSANDTFVSRTPRLQSFEPISPVRSKFAKYRPSGVHKENSGARANFAVPSVPASNPRPVRGQMRKSLSTSNINRQTPASRVSVLTSARAHQRQQPPRVYHLQGGRFK
ncbi:uncharacterized protein LOC144104654 [Amblyomma americanum]